jgi:cyclopropane-fatty-acyl-phospholipid synthase
VESLLGQAGVAIDGSEPWDIRVNNSRVFSRLISQGTLGLGEAYMDGDWDCERLDLFFERAITANLRDKIRLNWPLAWLLLLSWLQNRQAATRSSDVAKVHYDLPVDIFEATFDKRLTASCGYWLHASNLDDAQEAKLDLICRKIGVAAGNTVYDIGCGWGSFVGFAAERYGASCAGVTVSAEQARYIANRYANFPVRAIVQDYRFYDGPPADRVVSVGMFEHVGAKNHRTYFECARRAIQSEGLFLLHTIWENKRYPAIDPWQNKYLFPNGDLPSLGEITSAVEGLFVVEDVHNFGSDYDKTLMAWNENFQSNRNAMARAHGERFCRLWEYYLLQNAAAFRCRYINVGQLVLSPRGVHGGYTTVR